MSWTFVLVWCAAWVLAAVIVPRVQDAHRRAEMRRYDAWRRSL